MQKNQSLTAFSLVELSIVLVILGLLVGGVLAGQSLIRAAELRAVSTEYSRYVAATQSFRDKYFALPGDMSNATQFWGRLNTNADCVTNSGAAGPNANGACDGNANGALNSVTTAGQSSERIQFWRQLAIAGLIEGSYSGLVGTGGICTLGTDCPRSKMTNAGWGAHYEPPNFAGNSGYYAMDYGNLLRFGASSAGTIPSSPTLKPEEAWNIDTKLDDGKPASGKVIAIYWNNLCAVADDGTSALDDLVASYKLSDTSTQCALNFRQAF
jgi:type II secretory pathway pseudopilin PulG